MAEAVTFPGTEMPVIEKYPGSRRLDHPNFGDVYKTTFAVGVITDFKKIQDDPIKVEPIAKVQGDWGESDYLPIFYKPKESYWDDPEGKKATDFDDEKGGHAGSWQSFRADDEVVVMLKEGVPVAVVAFADGVPRPGENIIRMDNLEVPGVPGGSSGYSYLFFVSMLTQDKSEEVNESELGPDGKDLKLLLEHEPYLGDVTTDTKELTWYLGFCYDCPQDISTAWYHAHGDSHSAPAERG
jgi:hypothetical protein